MPKPRQSAHAGRAALTGLAFILLAGGSPVRAAQPSAPAAAYVVRDLRDGRVLSESRPGILDTPVLPGSVMKVVTLVAALESHVIAADTARLCRRVVVFEGVRYACSHPDLKRPLTPAEALAHSCNDYFIWLAPRLSREALNATRQSLGLPVVSESTPLAPALVGLDGPRIAPRALIGVLAQLAGVGTNPIVIRPETRRVLIDGLRGAAMYGTASAMKARGVSALAKTGTAPMPGGGTVGLVVALAPDREPTRGVVVVAPGAAGLDAAAIAADLLSTPGIGGMGLAPQERPGTKTTPPGSRLVRVGRTLSSGQTRIDEVDLEDYVAEVVAGEGQPQTGDAAQQALAITARTYAVANHGRHGSERFDLCDTTHCQALRPATASTRRAAAATAFRVLMHNGTPASVYHSASCGGQPERAPAVWSGATDYRGPTTDEACAAEPAWRSELTARDLERALRAAGVRGTQLTDLRVVARTASGRVARVRLAGWSPSDISGDAFRNAVGRALGWQWLKSTLFDLTRTGTGYRFVGRGFGHGVGLCVVGAGARAARGDSVEAILGFYFPTLTVSRLGTPASVADVTLVLPAEEEAERQVMLSLIRRARDELARATGVPAPASLRVTVHPTVESFARATGQRWFVAGASSGASIDLLPIGVLRRQRQLERTVRHELAHALVDAPLTGRPMWVREGAAAYFAAAIVSETMNPPLAGAACPSDQELRRPVAAVALGEAYRRALACFGRAVQAGTPWRDVK